MKKYLIVLQIFITAFAFANKDFSNLKIDFQPQSFEKFANEDVFFDVGVSGTNPTYQWQYSADNITWVDIDGATESYLEIPSASESDAGYYRCVVSNSFGSEISDSAELFIKPSPFATHPQNVIINYDGKENPTATFSLSLKPNVKPYEESNNAYEWQVNEYDFDNDEYIGWRTVDDPNASGYDSSTLTIKNIVSMDEDGYPIYNKNMYRCNLRVIIKFTDRETGKEGEDIAHIYTNAATLYVETMTMKDDMKESCNLYIGQNFAFNVDAKNILQNIYGKMSFTWFVNKNDGNGFVEIKYANLPIFYPCTNIEADGWQYYCVATNGVDRKYSTISTVKLKQAPEVSITPKEVYCFNGSNISFKVSVINDVNFNYQWQKLEGENWVDIDGENSPTLSFESVKVEDEGSYSCVVSDKDAIVISNIATLYVSSLLIESSPEASLEVFENTKHNLSVLAKERDGKKLTYTWYVDKNNGKGFVKAGSKPTLAITPKANMVGWQYYCVVSNGSETRNTSVSTIVAVKYPAKITGKPKALEAFEGVANSGFKVWATGSDLKYQWQVYKIVSYNAKGKPVYDWVNIDGATYSTFIPESTFENNGLKYRCRVYNSGSESFTSGVKYTVREAPKIEKIDILQCKEKMDFDGSTVVAYEEYPIDLQATAKGYKIKYQWYKNGIAIKGATKSKYTIQKPVESQNSYYCEVYNGDVKDQSSTFVLEVRECPMPASFEGHLLYVSDITDMGDPCRDMRMIFLNKNTLRFAMEDYAVSNPVWSYRRVSPTKATVSLKFKLYTNDEPVSKLNTISYSYSGSIEFKDNIFCLDLSDKKNGSFVGLFSDADMEPADKTSLLSLPINQKIIVGDRTLILLDKKNFALGEIQGTYTYKSNKNGTGVLKLNYKDGSGKYTAEVSMLGLSGKSGIAVVSTNWNEGKDKFTSSDFEEFEIAE